ncbi:MAG: hypothetical protein ABSD89_02215 [Halobacteriota archaeon]
MKKSDKSRGANEEEDLVITPAGPMPKDRVHAVGQDEAIRVEKSGKAVITSREEASSPKDIANDVVLTPGGWRARFLVHLIEPDHVLRVEDGLLQKRDPSGRVVAEFGQIQPSQTEEPLMPISVALKPWEVSALGSGWIEYAFWNNNTGTPVSHFEVTLTVPPAPSAQEGQTIFLFNGIQNSTMIYQPALQWGVSAAGGGKYWSVASWYAGRQGQAFYSTPVPVNPGDVLAGLIRITTRNPTGTFDYLCQFSGIANADLPVQNVPELTWCCVTLEAYGLTSCLQYPKVCTVFQGINVQTGTTHPALTWTPQISCNDCGQDVIGLSNANPGGGMNMCYGKSLPPRATPP